MTMTTLTIFFRSLRLALLAAILFPAGAPAEVSLPRLLSDGVVLQRGVSVPIHGSAEDGENVTVSLDGEVVAHTAAIGGRWRVEIPPRPGGGPHTIEVAGDNAVSVDDVYFGDVWIASGQSNMEMPMWRVATLYADDIAEADLPLVREFDVPRAYDFDAPREDVEGGEWRPATPESVPHFSAVGFFFARELHGRYDVPIGIISSNYGGSAAESWMSEEALDAYPHYLAIAKSYRDDEYLADLIEADRAVAAAWQAHADANDTGLAEGWSGTDVDDGAWATMSVPGYWADTPTGAVNGVVWFRKTVELPRGAAGKPGELLLGRIVDADRAWVNGVEVGNTGYQYPPRGYDVPADVLQAGENLVAVRVVSQRGNGGFVPDKPYELRVAGEIVDLEGDWHYRVGIETGPLPGEKFVTHRQPLGFHNAMLAPLFDTRIKGVIWYQGETNTDRPREYRTLIPAMIRDWRESFGQGDFPFLFVQLASFMEAYPYPTESGWAATREAQRLALSEPNTGMAVTIDVGEWNDIHPLDKKTVGERLALAARSIAYGEQDLVASGPMIRAARKCGGTVTLEFDHVGGGLVARGESLQGFAVAGENRLFGWADAAIEGRTVILTSDSVVSPSIVRYAWADNPDTANLYNAEGLPASPFEITIAGDRCP